MQVLGEEAAPLRKRQRHLGEMVIIEHNGSQPRTILPPGDIGQYLEIFRVVTRWGRGRVLGCCY